MRKRWLAAALAAGGIAFAVFALRGPSGEPIWTQQTGPDSKLVAFSPDGATVLTASVKKDKDGKPTAALLRRWRVDSGEAAGESELKLDGVPTLGSWILLLSPDGATGFFVFRPPMGKSPKTEDRSATCIVFAAGTGAARGPRIDKIDYMFARWISADGHRFGYMHSSPNQDRDCIRIAEVDSGKVIVELKRQTTEEPRDICFAPDGASVAAKWSRLPYRNGSHDSFVQIVELPSGREAKRLDLPPSYWGEIANWSRDRLIVHRLFTVGPAGYGVRKMVTFDASGDTLDGGAEDPNRIEEHDGKLAYTRTWREGHGWFADVTLEWRRKGDQNKSSLTRWLYPWRVRLGMKQAQADEQYEAITFRDAVDGHELRRLPYWLPPGNMISPTSRHVAYLDWQEGLMVWDTDPPWRPIPALAAAFAASAVVLLIGWRRSRAVVPAPTSGAEPVAAG